MTDKEKLMELYLKHGKREFGWDWLWEDLLNKKLICWVNTDDVFCGLVRLSPKALKLIREET